MKKIMAIKHVLWNKDTKAMEAGFLCLCPKCNGNGTVFGDSEDCLFCDGHGEVVQSSSSEYCRCVTADKKDTKIW